MGNSELGGKTGAGFDPVSTAAVLPRLACGEDFFPVGIGAAGCETATNRQVAQARDHAGDDGQHCFRRVVELGEALQQALRVRMVGGTENGLDRSALDEASGIHHGEIIAGLGDDGEIMRKRLTYLRKAIIQSSDVELGGITVAKNGMRDASYKEAEIMPHMKGRHIVIEADVGVAKGKATVWTCDLTHRYIDINGSYRS